MLIRMLVNITGNCDGVELPAPPGVVDLQDSSAVSFIEKGLAEAVPEEAVADAVATPEPDAVTTVAAEPAPEPAGDSQPTTGAKRS